MIRPPGDRRGTAGGVNAGPVGPRPTGGHGPWTAHDPDGRRAWDFLRGLYELVRDEEALERMDGVEAWVAREQGRARKVSEGLGVM